MKTNGNGGPGRTRPRRLLLCLDGVPHTLIEKARSRGLFEWFGKPARLLSPFPTMTNVALSAMFGATPPAGYESLYFDRDNNELRGGIKKYVGRRTPDKIPSSYMDNLDYQEPLAFEFLIYLAPEKVWRADMRRFHERFLAAPPTRDYFAFLKATDGLLHAQGPARLGVALETLDRILKQIHELCGDETEIVLFSDHGMNLEKNRRVDLVTQLGRRNLKVVSQLTEGRTMAVPAFGLCSYAAAYCGDEELIPEASDVMIEIPGVDFVVYREDSSVLLKSLKGTIRIEKHPLREAYRYLAGDGDPLDLAPTIQLLKNESKLDEAGFASDEDWYEKTKLHSYPDAVRNIYKSLFSARVKHSADILISLHDGYYYGWSPFEKFVTLAATRGNALAASSNAFLMSSYREVPEIVRADDAKELLVGGN